MRKTFVVLGVLLLTLMAGLSSVEAISVTNTAGGNGATTWTWQVDPQGTTNITDFHINVGNLTAADFSSITSSNGAWSPGQYSSDVTGNWLLWYNIGSPLSPTPPTTFTAVVTNPLAIAKMVAYRVTGGPGGQQTLLQGTVAGPTPEASTMVLFGLGLAGLGLLGYRRRKQE